MSKCKHKKLLLGYAYITEIEPDQEPYKAGVEIKKDTIDLTYNAQEITCYWCEKCKTLVSVECE